MRRSRLAPKSSQDLSFPRTESGERSAELDRDAILLQKGGEMEAKPTHVIVDCCYCRSHQRAEYPPSLHNCTECKRDFRVYFNVSGTPEMLISDEAKRALNKNLKPKKGSKQSA